MIWMIDERRSRRSADRQTALRYQLERVQERGNIEALVLADGDGLLLAQAGAEGVCEELGAMAPLATRSPMGMPPTPLLRGADIAIRSIRCHGQDLYLASLGGGVARDALLTHGGDGVRRILSVN